MSRVLLLALALAVTAATADAQRRNRSRESKRGRPAAVTDQYDETFRKYSKRYFGVGHDWRYFKAQAMAESNLQPGAKSWVGARGLMQLMPNTYQAIASRQPELQSIDDPEWNIAAGIMHDRYLWRYWKDHGQDPERRACMFASYNAGQGTLNRAHRMAESQGLDRYAWSNIEQIAPRARPWRYRETLGYVKKIEANYRMLVEEDKKKPGK